MRQRCCASLNVSEFSSRRIRGRIGSPRPNPSQQLRGRSRRRNRERANVRTPVKHCGRSGRTQCAAELAGHLSEPPPAGFSATLCKMDGIGLGGAEKTGSAPVWTASESAWLNMPPRLNGNVYPLSRMSPRFVVRRPRSDWTGNPGGTPQRISRRSTASTKSERCEKIPARKNKRSPVDPAYRRVPRSSRPSLSRLDRV